MKRFDTRFKTTAGINVVDEIVKDLAKCVALARANVTLSPVLWDFILQLWAAHHRQPTARLSAFAGRTHTAPASHEFCRTAGFKELNIRSRGRGVCLFCLSNSKASSVWIYDILQITDDVNYSVVHSESLLRCMVQSQDGTLKKLVPIFLRYVSWIVKW